MSDPELGGDAPVEETRDDVRSEETGYDGLVEVVHAHGHENVTADHASTFEFTADDWLTPAGDCILAVGADRTPRDFPPAFRDACRDRGATIVATVTVEGDDGTHTETVAGRGDPDLTLVDDRSMVGRTSDYTDDERTIMVDADAAAVDFDRDLVDALSAGAAATLRLEVDPAEDPS